MKHFKLPKEFAIKWLAALRSDKYTQITGSLIDYGRNDEDDEYELYNENAGCCLGIARLVCNITPQQMIGSNMPDDLSDSLLLEMNYPSELTDTKKADAENNLLQDILAVLNDGFNNEKYKDFIKEYPELIFKKLPQDNTETIRYDFKEIAEFVEDNCEFYDATEQKVEKV